jgi:hypothetical protein
MPQPSDTAKATRQAAATAAGGVVRQYRPQTDTSLPQVVQDAFRQMPDQIYNLRQEFGPRNIYVQGSGDPVTVTTDVLGIGLSFKLNRTGKWVINAAVALTIAADPSQVFTLFLAVGGKQQGLTAQWNSATDGQIMMHQQWMFNSQTGDDTVSLLISKDGGSGTSAVNPLSSTLTAVYAGTQ